MQVMDGKRMREADAIALEEYQIPTLLLMDRAADALMKEVLRWQVKRVCILCGLGNNGSDGLALATQLQRFTDISVSVVMLGEGNQMPADGQVYYQIMRALNIRSFIQPGLEDLRLLLHESELLVDCLFGTGLNRGIDGLFYDVIESVNASGKPVISCDIPSGIHADTGQVLGTAVKAKVTVTFQNPKLGLYLEPGSLYCGEIVIADIGVPNVVMERLKSGFELLDQELAHRLLPPRARNANKYTCGTALIIGGSKGMSGALQMCVKACLYSGCGLTTYAAPACIMNALTSSLPQAISIAVSDKQGHFDNEFCDELFKAAQNVDVIAFGCGAGRSEDVERILERLLLIDKPLIIDADGLWALSRRLPLLKKRRSATILTPHMGEMQRLCAVDKNALQSDVLRYAFDFVNEYPVTLVLKGMRTLILEKGRLRINTTGNEGLAKGGSGDVLCGMITALMAQQKQAFDAASLGVYLHGLAADLQSQHTAFYAMTANELIQGISDAFLAAMDE
ncbi:NAD(P)H-hydrate dehydratase [Dielma fastidiosa]